MKSVIKPRDELCRGTHKIIGFNCIEVSLSRTLGCSELRFVAGEALLLSKIEELLLSKIVDRKVEMVCGAKCLHV